MTDRLYEEIQNPITGVAVKSRKILRPLAMGYKSYKGCFTGTDAVSWIVGQQKDASRSSASSVLQGWYDKGLIRRIGVGDGFEDDRNALYQFATVGGGKRRIVLDGDSGVGGGGSSRGGATSSSSLSSSLSSSSVLREALGPLVWCGQCSVRRREGGKSKGKVHVGHFVAVVRGEKGGEEKGVGTTVQYTVQVGRAAETWVRVAQVWAMRTMEGCDVERTMQTETSMWVRWRRDKTSVVEYVLEMQTRRERDELLAALLNVSVKRMGLNPKTSFDWQSVPLTLLDEAEELRRQRAGGGGGEEDDGRKQQTPTKGETTTVSLEGLESLQLTEEDVACQQRLWETMERTGQLTAQAAAEDIEWELEQLERRYAEKMIELDPQLVAVHGKMQDLHASTKNVRQMVAGKMSLVAEGEAHIRAIRGHEAQRERSERHLRVLCETLQLLMSSLSVPPRLLNMLREPSFNSDDPNDMVTAIRAVDKVITLKDLDQRLLKMRAVSDRSQEYKTLLTSFATQLMDHCKTMLAERAASRAAASSSSTPPAPFHMHLVPFIPVFNVLNPSYSSQLMEVYMSVAKSVYQRDCTGYFSVLLNTVRRQKEMTVLEGFHLALQAVWGLIQSELDFWRFLSDDDSKLKLSASAQRAGRVLRNESSNKNVAMRDTVHLASVVGGAAGVSAAAVMEGEDGLDASSITLNQELVYCLGDIFVEIGEQLNQFLEYSDRHSPLDVIGMMVEAQSWRNAGEPMQDLPVVIAISSRLSGTSQRFVQKLSEIASSNMRESHMARGKAGALASFTRLPMFLDNIHSYGPGSRNVTSEICDKVLNSLLEWLESPEVVKELIKFDSSKMTIFAGRYENYYYLYNELVGRAEKINYLEGYALTCRERYERNMFSFITYMWERYFKSLHEYFSAIIKMKRSIPSEEIQFQVTLSRAAFAQLNKKYSVSAWEKKLLKMRKIIAKTVSAPMFPLLWNSFREFVLARIAQYRELLAECYGPSTNFAVDDLEKMFDAVSKQ